MKQTIFICLVFFLIITISAQDKKQQKVFFGVGGGVNISFFNTGISEYGNEKNKEFKGFFRFSPSIHATIKYMFSKDAFLKTGLMYNFRGGAYVADENRVTITTSRGFEKGKKHRRFLLNYVEVPLMFGYNIRKLLDKKGGEKGTPVNLAVGVTGGFNTLSKFKVNYYRKEGGGFGPIVDVEEDFETFDFDYANSFLMNAIVELSILTDTFSNVSSEINIRYNQSINNVYNVNELAGENFKTKMGTITIGFSFEFLK